VVSLVNGIYRKEEAQNFHAVVFFVLPRSLPPAKIKKMEWFRPIPLS
jgi:hypothetical protein